MPYNTFVHHTPPMYRTLKDLKDRIDQLIEDQGEDASCAAFVFTKNDVFYYQMNDDGTNLEEGEVYLNDEDTEEVLSNVGGCDYIYEQIGEIIDDEVRRLKHSQTVA